LKKQTKLRLQISDLNGKKVKAEAFSGNGKIAYKVHTSLFASGVYVFSVYEGQQLLGSGKVVIER